MTVARNRALDRIRAERAPGGARAARLRPRLRGAAGGATGDEGRGRERSVSPIPDERLRLIFTCCHPALAPEARVALTLRAARRAHHRRGRARVPGLRAGDGAAGRAREGEDPRRRDRVRGPRDTDLPARLGSVLATLYLVFNEGYAATSGDELIRRELSAEAIRLARVLCALMPDEGEALALLALMRLHDSRRATRVDAEGRLVLLADQDRGAWDRTAIAEGLALTERALALGSRGRYALQAVIAAEHARAARRETPTGSGSPAPTTASLEIDPSPVVALNRAVAVAMAHGPEAGPGARGRAGRGPRRLPPAPRHPGRPAAPARPREEARAAYERALELAARARRARVPPSSG